MSLPNPAIPPADASIPVEVVPATSIGFRLASGSELISGYRLQERIGVGGYGEVWSAIAPGGMVKAVKILYGRLEESRASHELKALYRVKGLRHPFLLTLERIEVVDGHLVVVTELADSNLKERFQQCRDSGLPGLPREELLRYLEEAADALDYLSDSHSLQHLDVKPENLLLVSNHVKVGDYGLLKDLQDTSVSMISGLTPRYASPEVFDGRPSRRSDQYSLAIVFQEMATGELPFDGRTSATLATQHLHSAPNLAGLTAQERFAIGKALSKDPVRRFGSCREFVARLMHRGTATILTGTTGIGPAGATGSGRPEGRPAACSRSESSAPSDSHPAAIHDGQTIVVGKPEAISLPAIALGQEAPTYRPAVFIGLGGTGGRVLSRLRQLLTDCYGDGPACPALQFLYIDTDIASINEVSMRAGDGTLREDETIATPLRQTWHYRTSALGNLLSLSRRWIYNIPRSLRTEGMRALGRLALLDHSRQIVGRLRSAIRSAIDGEAVRLTARHTGLGFSETDPRVFLVASIAGGTGGGMVLDTAYAVRQVLAEEGLSDDHVYGILTYSTASGDKARNLAPPSAYACLQELQYFSLDGCDYPGEPGCGLAGFRETGPALKSTYLIDLGDNLEEAQFAQEVDRVATYLLLNSVSPASMFFDKCRQLEREEFGDTEFKVRTVGLAPLKTDTHEVRAQWVEDLSKAVVRRWQGADGTSGAEEPIRLSDYARLFEACETAESPTRGLEKMAAKQMAELRVDRDRLPCLLQEAFRERLGTDVGSYLEKIVSESLGSLTDTLAEPLVTGVLRRVHAIAGVKEGCDPALADRLQSLRDVGVSIAGALGHRLGGALQSWLLELVDTFQAPTAAARQTADWMAGCLESLESEVRAQLAVAETERSRHLERLLQLGADPKANRRAGRAATVECLRGYAAPLATELLLEAGLKAVRAIRPFVTAGSDRLRELWKDLNRLSEEFAVATETDNPPSAPAGRRSPSDSFLAPLAEVYADCRQELVEQLDRQVQTAFFGAKRPLRQFFTEGAEVRADLVAAMRGLARKAILRCGSNATISGLREALAGNNLQGLAVALECSSEAAAPKLPGSCRGGRRLLLAVPEGLDPARLGAEVRTVSGEVPTAIAGSWQETMLCHEVEQLALEDIAPRFLRSRSDCEEIASRLHTRIDVNW